MTELSTMNWAIQEASRVQRRDPLFADAWFAWVDGLMVHDSAEDHEALVNAAFTTFCRTMLGFGSSCSAATKARVKGATSELFAGRLALLSRSAWPELRASYDAWHLQTMEELRRLWIPVWPLSWGQAQKWTNILIKYYAAFGEAAAFPRVRAQFLPALHTPIDNIVYDMLLDADDVPFAESSVSDWYREQRFPRWSRIEDLDVYSELQAMFRTIGDREGIPPCAIELFAWG